MSERAKNFFLVYLRDFSMEVNGKRNSKGMLCLKVPRTYIHSRHCHRSPFIMSLEVNGKEANENHNIKVVF